MGDRGKLKLVDQLTVVPAEVAKGSAAADVQALAPQKPRTVASNQDLSDAWDTIVPELDRAGLVGEDAAQDVGVLSHGSQPRVSGKGLSLGSQSRVSAKGVCLGLQPRAAAGCHLRVNAASSSTFARAAPLAMVARASSMPCAMEAARLAV